MKNIYYIEDLMKELDIKSRSTFWRKQKCGDIPPPRTWWGGLGLAHKCMLVGMVAS